MEWIGLIALLVIGAYAIIAGIVLNSITVGFAGKISIEGIALCVFGLMMLYVAWINKPFEIVISQ